MSTLRFHALKEVFNQTPVNIKEKWRSDVLKFLEQNVFNETTMRQYLTKDAFESVMDAIKKDLK